MSLSNPLPKIYECYECDRMYETPESAKMCAVNDKNVHSSMFVVGEEE
jgi:hypothetical protein